MENEKGSSDGEDIPSDFFDDFNKDEFIEGLSVIDSWDEDKKPERARSRIDAEAVDNVRDLRELIDREEEPRGRPLTKFHSRFKWVRRSLEEQRRQLNHSGSNSNLDEVTKPGSRRDPNKTNEAIKKDKEVKVKEHLAKHLESGSDLCPPGTELDDFFDERKCVDTKDREPRKIIAKEPSQEYRTSTRRRRESYEEERNVRRRFTPPKYRREHWSPRRHYSPHRSRDHHFHHSPPKYFRKFYKKRFSPESRRFSPESRRFSPESRRFNPESRRLSPESRRLSPGFRRFTAEYHTGRSPQKRYRRESRSRSRSSKHRPERKQRSWSRSSNHKAGPDDFLYPKEYFPPPDYSTPKPEEIPYGIVTEPQPQYVKPAVEYTNYTYPPGQAYSGYGVPYEYGVAPNPEMGMPVPQPVPAPVMGAPIIPSMPNPMQPIIPLDPMTSTAMVPAPLQSSQDSSDPLAKLVADGILSHEDYLKLTPNKGVSKVMDTDAKVVVMKRCHTALTRLGTIMLPNQLVINNDIVGSELKEIAPKYCSPLKRQATIEFPFTKHDTSAIYRQNKLILESIAKALRIEKIVTKKKKDQKETSDVGVQKTMPHCDVCEIREKTKYCDASTSTDPELFTSSVETQVIERDLYSSKPVFKPTMADGANISIAHMTPAQLVSQLAAKAKTLKQDSSTSQYRQNYNYDGRSDNYRPNYNYRY